MVISIRGLIGIGVVSLVLTGAGCAGRASDADRIAQTHKQVIKSDLLMLQDDFDSAALWNQESRLTRYSAPALLIARTIPSREESGAGVALGLPCGLRQPVEENIRWLLWAACFASFVAQHLRSIWKPS